MLEYFFLILIRIHLVLKLLLRIMSYTRIFNLFNEDSIKNVI